MRPVNPQNRMLTYSTGRTYDAPQVLEIELLSHDRDEFGILTGSALFVDRSRHIAARVDFVSFGDTDDQIGRAVTAAYDGGNYYAKIFSHFA